MNKKSLFLKFAFAIASLAATSFFAARFTPPTPTTITSTSFLSLVLTRSVYVGNASTVTVREVLPPSCVAGNVSVPLLSPPASPGSTASVAVTCGVASADGTFPGVFNNANTDGSFGVTSPIFIDNLTSTLFASPPNSSSPASAPNPNSLSIAQSTAAHSLS